MGYYKFIDNGYVLAIGTGYGGKKIVESEYNSILEIIHNRPSAPYGYGYRLTADLKWELYEFPTEDQEEEATTEDYQAALAELGVIV